MFDTFATGRFATLDNTGSQAGGSGGSGRFFEGDEPATNPSFGAIASYQICGCCGVYRGPIDGSDDGQGVILNADDRGGFGSNGKPSLSTVDAGVQISRTGQSWSTALGTGAVVTYAFRSSITTMPTDTQGFSQFSNAQIAATIQAMAAWSDVANIVFNRVTDTGSQYSDNATILLGNYSSGQDGAAAFAYLPGGRPGATASSAVQGDVWINSSIGVNAAPLQQNYGQLTLLHEIGHAIGLSHPAAYNASAGTSITYGANATYFEDSLQYSVMSYFSERATGANFSGGLGSQARYASVPLLDDIAAVQRLYGANTTTRTGDTIYGFNSNAGQVWFNAANASAALIFAVWDAGGVDTFDFSGYAADGVIDLRQGAFSSVGGLTGNVSIAVGAIIENAIGGSGADSIRGNSGNNRLTGNGGNDTIDGGLGSDTVVFSGARSAYTITWNGQTGTVMGPEGTVTIRNVEFLAFSDQTVAATPTGGLMVAGDITNETISGTAFSDTIGGLGGSDTLNGLDGNDTLDGGSGADTLNGGNGDDVLIGGLGNDTLDGGAGIDVADYSGAGVGVTVNLAAGTTGGGAGVDTLTAIENVTGSAFADTITGDNGVNVLRGGGGIDVLNGGGGNDQLFAGTPGFTGGAPDVVKAAGTANATIATAVSLTGAFDLLPNAEIANSSTIPHATVTATTHGGVEYYAVTVQAGDRVTFDIDGASFDSTLRLFSADGVELASNDDLGADGTNTTDSGLSFTFATAGTYYIQVAEWAANTGTTFTSEPPDAGETYTLHVSATNAATVPLTSTGSELNGDAGADRLEGSSGIDILNGGADDDTIIGAGGDDVIDGGTGTDTAVFSGNRSAYTITSSNGVTTITGADGTDRLTNVERLQFADGLRDINGNIVTEGGPINGTAGDDVLDGTAQADTINGGDGNDTISGGAGDDTLNGEAGNDLLSGGLGADLLNGGAGTDRVTYADATTGIVVDLAAQIAFDGASYDYMSSIENATGSAFADTLVGSNVANDILGGAGNDTISGGAGDDVLVGEAGDDILSGGQGGDLLFGGEGTDRVTYADATTGVVVDLTGQIAFDGANYDYMSSIENATGSGLSDTLVGSDVANDLMGGAGDDTLSGLGGQDNLFGGDGNDVISGGAADDVLYGEAGDDVLSGGQGGDILFGGAGIDRVTYADATTGVVVDLAAQIAFDGANYDYMSSIESATGSAFADNLSGSNVANDISGGAGNDIISGGAGDDVLYGEDGDDVLSGGQGGDILFGGQGADRVTYADATTGIVVDLTAQIAFDGANYDYMASIENATGSAFADTLVGSEAANDLIGGAGNDTLSGLGGQDNLYGGDGNDVISGGAADDVLYGEAGDDVLSGGQGGDVLFGGTGSDRTTYADATTGVVVDLAAQIAFDGASYDYMSSIENATGSAFADTLEGSSVANDIRGGAGNDIISGGAGDDILYGEDGDDVLSGGQGGDILFGGEGSDRVTYAAVATGVVVDLTAQIAFDGANYDYMSSIENATGSAFADTLVGSNVANDLIGGNGNDVLIGEGGNDRLDGGAGNDVARYAGTLSEYAIESVGNGVWQVTDLVAGRSGVDTLTGIEQLSFADGSVFSLGQSAQLEALSGKGTDDQPLVLPAAVADEFFVQPLAPIEKVSSDNISEPQVQPVEDDFLVFDDEPMVWPAQDTVELLGDFGDTLGGQVFWGAGQRLTALLADNGPDLGLAERSTEHHENWVL